MSRTRAEPLAEQIERLFLLLLRQRAESSDAEQPALTATQRLALAILASGPPLRLGLLAESMATTNATASRTVDALERLGLATREADPLDRRGVVVTATQPAKRLVAERRRRLRRSVERGLGALSAEDQERLVGLLARLNDVLGATSPREGSGRGR
ncbi:MAG: MarR family transcriptional regulator [Actinobacteria bacterium]|nr:MarR family transcriptional regulator [Actinomycetota bacterium]